MASLVALPPSASFTESPILVNVGTANSDGIFNSSSLQHVLQLYVWNGNKADRPSSPSFTLRRFPVLNNTGTSKRSNFDLSSILSSYTTASLVELYEGADDVSNTQWFSVNAYDEALTSGSTTTYVTGSNDNNFTNPRIATEGYLKWGENKGFNRSLYSFDPSYPFLSSAPVTESVSSVTSNIISRTDLPFFFSLYLRHDADSEGGYSSSIDNYYVVDSLGNGYVQSVTGYGDTQSTSSIMVRDEYVPSSYVTNFYLSGSEWFSVVARDNTNSTIGGVIKTYFDCQKKYTPVRIAFKNRYGTLDQFEFNLVSRKSFSVDTKTFKQNALSDTLTTYQTEKGDTTYYTDGKESITVNTDFIDEAYNDFFKEMMVSDEIYMIDPYVEGVGESTMDANITPLILQDKNITLRTSEVDKLVQYTFSFDYGTPFKLTL